jgi:CRP/FNR family transcriptional regulator, cyclic AMP receptor protein
MARDGKVDLMRKVPLFSKLKGKTLQEVASIADEIDLPKGKELARQGDRGREFFIILDGEAEVRKDGRRVNTLGKGEFFGEIALVTKVPRTASVTTSTPVRALVITDRDFSALIKRSPEVSVCVLEALGERLAHDLT